MILLVHLLFGAAIGSVVKNVPLAIVLAFLGHYLLDFIPHTEYSLAGTGRYDWIKMWPNILKISIDFFSGILIILLFSNNQPIIYICAFFAILPDGFTVINNFIPNKITGWHDKLHTKKIHFLKYKKIPNFWRILSQVAVAVIFVVLLKT